MARRIRRRLGPSVRLIALTGYGDPEARRRTRDAGFDGHLVKPVFPETLGPFLLGHPLVREVFLEHHADLLDPAFWQSHKERILAGHVHDIFPYERERRLRASAQPDTPPH